jgi:hypothetical protein
MADIWRTRDRFGREVVLTEAGMEHILERRPRMAGRERDIRAVLEDPKQVNRDAQHPDRECFYGGRGDGPYLKVVVAYRADDFGLVITAYPAQYVKRGEPQLWP